MRETAFPPAPPTPTIFTLMSEGAWCALGAVLGSGAEIQRLDDVVKHWVDLALSDCWEWLSAVKLRRKELCRLRRGQEVVWDVPYAPTFPCQLLPFGGALQLRHRCCRTWDRRGCCQDRRPAGRRGRCSRLPTLVYRPVTACRAIEAGGCLPSRPCCVSFFSLPRSPLEHFSYRT